jgi:hypothetical protein
MIADRLVFLLHEQRLSRFNSILFNGTRLEKINGGIARMVRQGSRIKRKAKVRLMTG